MSRLAAAANPTPSVYGESEADFDGSMAEAELHRVQRQVRQLDYERKGYTEELRSTLNRQQNTLEGLRKANDALQDDLKLLKSLLESQKKTGVSSKKAELLKEQSESYHQKLKAASLQSTILEKKLNEIQKALTKQRELLSSHATSQSAFAAQKQVINLESRLDKALARYNKSLEVISKMRENIGVLRHERNAFDTVYKRYESELQDIKHSITEISENCANSYESREECQIRMVALKEKNEKEHQSYLQEVKELERQLEQDRKLKEFLVIKTAERADYAENVQKHLHAPPVVKSSYEVLAEKMDTYEVAYDNIRRFTGCKDIKELVKRFSTIEDENFSLFNYVNEINNQLETINNEILSVQGQIDAVKQENEAEETERNKEIAKLEEKLKATQALTDHYNKQQELASQSLDSIRKFVDYLFGLLKLPPVDNSSVSNKVPLSTQLASIEHKASDLLMKNLLLSLPKKFAAAAMPAPGSGTNVAANSAGNKEPGQQAEADKAQAAAQSDASKDPVAIAAILQALIDSGEISQTEGEALRGLLGQGPNAPVSNLSVKAPTTGFNLADIGDDTEEEDEEEAERPLSRGEMKEKTLRRLMKREQQNQLETDSFGLNDSHTSHKVAGAKSHRRKPSKRVAE